MLRAGDGNRWDPRPRQPQGAPRGRRRGDLFSLLLIVSLALIRSAVPADPGDPGSWLPSHAKTVALALNILPFAGVAFLWFIGVLRDRIGDLEDKLFASVFLGSGLLFLAMLFASAAIAGGVLTTWGTMPGQAVESGVFRFARTTIFQLINVYGMRMAGVFMITTCTLAIRTGIFPRPMAFLGYALALLLLLGSGRLPWVPMAFPVWTLLVSVQILVANFRSGPLDGTETRAVPGRARRAGTTAGTPSGPADG